MNGETAVLGAWVAETAIQTWKSTERVVVGMPPVSLYVADLALFGGLALAAKSESASTFCALLAWGYVAATLVNGGQSLANTMVKKVSTLNTTAGASGASAATAAATPSTVPFIGPPAGQ